MRLSYILAFSTALIAVSSAELSEKCKKATSEAGAEVDRCFPLKRISDQYFQKDQDIQTLKTEITQHCTKPVCTTADKEAILRRLLEKCSGGNKADEARATLGKYYISAMLTLKEVACYVDQDKKLVVLKNPWILKYLAESGTKPLKDEISPLDRNVVCTKATQHALGAIFKYYENGEESVWVPASRTAVTEMCGAKFVEGLASAIGAPYPEIQKTLGIESPPN